MQVRILSAPFMSRFTDIVKALRLMRTKLVEDNRAKRAKKGRGGPRKPRAPRKVAFDSPELEAIFNGMSEECQALIRNGK